MGDARSQLATLLSLAFCVLGIYASYLTQGVVQETLSTKKFGPEGERFSHLSSLNAVQCWVCFLWASLLLALFGSRCAGVWGHRRRRRRRQRCGGASPPVLGWARAPFAAARACPLPAQASHAPCPRPRPCRAARRARRGRPLPPTGSPRSPTAWAPPAACRPSSTSPTPPRCGPAPCWDAAGRGASSTDQCGVPWQLLRPQQGRHEPCAAAAFALLPGCAHWLQPPQLAVPHPHPATQSHASPPIQVLAKSSKMIPVMLMGTVLHGKRYSMLEYACCLAISGAQAAGAGGATAVGAVHRGCGGKPAAWHAAPASAAVAGPAAAVPPRAAAPPPPCAQPGWACLA